MRCPFCASSNVKVLDTRESEIDSTRRRRECLDCHKRFTTYETVEGMPITVIKRDGSKQQFDREKLKRGMELAARKRLTGEKIESLVEDVEKEVRSLESTDVKSTKIGSIVLKVLKAADPVTYLRFASVYRDFKDYKSFEKEVESLKKSEKKVKRKNNILQIRKRAGTIALFDPMQITESIIKAMQAVGETDPDLADALTDDAIFYLEKQFDSPTIITVEEIQDATEKILIENNLVKIAKEYILQRHSKTKAAETRSAFVDVANTIGDYVHQRDWRVRENSNEGFSLSGLMLYAAGKLIANYTLNEIYSRAIAEGHKKGYYHIHDLSNGIVGYSFYRNETVVVRERDSQKVFVLSLEQLYDLLKEAAVSENGFDIKYSKNYEILDEVGWTDVLRVLRHKTTKPLISFNTYRGSNLIVTADHPFITLKDRKVLAECDNCHSMNVIKSRSNKNGIDYFKCRACSHAFKKQIESIPELNQREEKLAQDITLSSCAITPTFILENLQPIYNINAKDAWFLGLFIAEGYFMGNYLVFEFCSSVPELEKLFSYLSEANIDYASYERNADANDNGTVLLSAASRITVRVNVNKLPAQLKILASQIRAYSENKNLPIEFLGLPNNAIGGLVAGVIDGDGTVRNDDLWVSRVNIRVTSKTLLSQIQFWLRINNISSTLSTINSYGDRLLGKRVISSKKQLYSLTFYIPEKKKELFRECMKIDNNFKFSHADYKPKTFSHFRKIEEIENDSEYVYDITTGSHTFNCNGILAHNCAGWSLKNLLLWGFGGIPNKTEAKPAKHLRTVINQMINYIGCLQMEFAGAQAFSSVDTLLAPFVRYDNLSFKDTKQCIQELIFSLNIPSRWGCFAPGEYIFSSNGLTEIQNASNDLNIATKNGVHAIKHVWNNGEKEMFRLRTKAGYEVVATSNHQIRDEALEFRELGNFRTGDKIPISSNYMIFGNSTTVPNTELAEVMGSTVADGCIFKWKSNDRKNKRRKLSIYYDEKDKDVAERHLGILKKNGVSATILKNRTAWMLTSVSNKAYDLFSEFGITEAKSHVKEVPKTILTAPKEIQLAFLRGLFESDGSIFYRGQISYTTTSEKLAKQLKLMLLNLGIFSNTMVKAPRTAVINGREIKSEHKVYEMRIAGNRAKKFKKTIGFVSERKNRILEKEVRDLKEEVSDVLLDEIKSIEPIGKMDSYDLTINPNPEYIVNGFYVHNSQYPFSNLTFDWMIPDDMKSQKAIVGGKEQEYTYGDCQKEADMINKAFLEVMLEGDAKGSIFSFPIPTYNLTKDFNWDSENANLLFEMTAKYGTPYFQNFIGSDMDPKSIRAMCCRLNLNLLELTRRPGHIFAMGDNTGSIGVVTLNMNRLGFEAKTKEDFFAKLGHYMDLAKESLEIKRKVIQANLDAGLTPYTKRYLGHFNNHFSTIGLVGMNEACINFLGKGIATKEGKDFAIDVLNFMRERLIKYQRETGNLYNLEATPAEGCSYRLARSDKQLYGDKIYCSGKDFPFLTNSTHLPVDFTDDAVEALQHQNDIQHLYTGGTIFHTFLGERMSNGEACKALVKKIAYNTKIPYFSITPTFSICKEHGYIPGEHFTCPVEIEVKEATLAVVGSGSETDSSGKKEVKRCEKECEVFSRIVGYYRPVQRWHDGKQEEFKFRNEYDEKKSIAHRFENEKTGKEPNPEKLTALVKTQDS